MRRPRPECPQCHATRTIPIIYGYPAPELERDAARGKVRLGGCCVSPSHPQWYCPACEHEWRTKPPDAEFDNR